MATNDPSLSPLLTRIAEALERLAPPARPPVDLHAADAFVWDAQTAWLHPVAHVAHVPLPQLKGIERQKDLLLGNTQRFAAGRSANNALLWGARGMGKSALVKSVWAKIARPKGLALIEIHRDDIATLPQLLEPLRGSRRRFLIYCDDLSFERADAHYKALKSALDGSLAGRPENVLFYATSNQRHLMPRDMSENDPSAIFAAEHTEEHVSLADRFGLWIGFHRCDQDTYLAIVDGYAKALALAVEAQALHAEALEWSATRGGRSGRVAWQFIQDLAGRIAHTSAF